MAISDIFNFGTVNSLRGYIGKSTKAVLYPESSIYSDDGGFTKAIQRGRLTPFVILSSVQHESLTSSIGVSNKPLETGEVFPEHFYIEPLTFKISGFVTNLVYLEMGEIVGKALGDVLGDAIVSTASFLSELTEYRKVATEQFINWQRDGRYINTLFFNFNPSNITDRGVSKFYISDVDTSANMQTGTSGYAVSLQLKEAPLTDDDTFETDLLKSAGVGAQRAVKRIFSF